MSTPDSVRRYVSRFFSLVDRSTLRRFDEPAKYGEVAFLTPTGRGGLCAAGRHSAHPRLHPKVNLR